MERKRGILMQIKYIHSHLNGYEFLMVQHPELLEEIKEIIENINAEEFITKKSDEKNRLGRMLYNPGEFNKAFKAAFNGKEWAEEREIYYLTSNMQLAYDTVSLPSNEQKKLIEEAGETAFYSYNQTGYLKNKVAVEFQFGKYAFVAYDLFVKHLSFYLANKIDVGIEIIPTKAMTLQMSNGIAYYESEVYNIYRQGRNNPAVPLVLIGIEP